MSGRNDSTADGDAALTVARRLFDQGTLGIVRIDDRMRVAERHGGLVETVGDGPAPDVLPFLVGYEDVITAVATGEMPSFSLPKVTVRNGKAGFGRTVSVRIAPGDTPGDAVVMMQDVTEQAALEQQIMQTRNELALTQRALIDAKIKAEAASAAKSAFLRLISHDLRTPLGVVIGNAEILRDEVADDGPLGELLPFIDDIRDSGRYLLELINDLLDLARGEAGTLPLEIQAVRVADPVDEAIRLVRALPGAEHLDITATADPATPEVNADAQRLKQVFVNLLANAVKFTPPGGRVAVAIAPDGDGGAVVTVADTGCGISPEDRERVLRPFEQVRGARSGSGGLSGGVGLGLPIARMLTEQHGGTLTLDSEPGLSTTITIRLPAADMSSTP